MRAAATACAVSAVLAGAGAAPGDALRPPCPPRGQAAIVEDGELVIYRPKTGPGTPDTPVVACLRGSATRMTLVTAPTSFHRPKPPHSGNLGMIATASPVVAYVVHQLTGVDTAASRLVVVDVATRTVLREAPAGYSIDAGFAGYEGISALDVTSRGEVAWIEERDGRRHSERSAAVIAAPRTGPAVVLDEGPGVAPRSLYLSGSTVHWVDGEETRGAPLP